MCGGVESAAPHTPWGSPLPVREARVETLLGSISRRLHRNPSWNLLNQNGQASVPGGRGLSAKQRTRNWGVALRQVWVRREQEGERPQYCVQAGLGPRPGATEEAEHPCESGVGPVPHLATHPPEFGKTSSAAQASGSPAGRSVPSVWPSSGFPQHPKSPLPEGPSHSTGAKPNSSSSSSQSPAKPSPLCSPGRPVSRWQKPDSVSPRLQTLCLSPHSLPHTDSC